MDRAPKRARDSVGGGRPRKTARVGASRSISPREDVPVPRRREGGEEEVTVNRIMRARDVRDGVVLPLVWDNPDAIPYVCLRQQFLDAWKFGALPSHGRATRVLFEGMSRYTIYGAWCMRQEAWGNGKKHGVDGMNMPVLRDESEKLYVVNLAKFSHDVDAGRLSKDWLGYCMLPWPYYTLSFLSGSRMWRDAIRYECRYRTDPDGAYFIGWHNKEFFPVPLEEKRCSYVTAPVDWKSNEPCRAHAVPSSPVFSYKSNAMVGINNAGAPSARK